MVAGGQEGSPREWTALQVREWTGCRGGGSGTGTQGREETDVEAHRGLGGSEAGKHLQALGLEVVGHRWRKGSGRSQVEARRSRREGRETEHLEVWLKTRR